jgi:hypothetical protein
VTAVGNERQDAPVAGLDARYAFANFGYGASSLVAQNDWHGEQRRAVHNVYIAGAKASHVHLDANLASFRRVLLKVFDYQRLFGLVKYGCFHDLLSRIRINPQITQISQIGKLELMNNAC